MLLLVVCTEDPPPPESVSDGSVSARFQQEESRPNPHGGGRGEMAPLCFCCHRVLWTSAGLERPQTDEMYAKTIFQTIRHISIEFT